MLRFMVMNTAWLRRHKIEIAIIAVLLLVAGLPRLLDLGTFLTADEKNWIGRSYEFVRAFKDFRFNDMLQTTHPGVTTMWLTGLSVTAKMLIDHVPFSFGNLIHFVKAAQLPIALLTTLLVPVIYLLLRQLFNRPLAIVAAFLIALDPFLIGYSRVAHVDALVAYFIFIAALALLLYRREYNQRWLLVSALVTGLAFLTKVPAVFLIPFFGLVVLTDRRMWAWSNLNSRLKDFIIWGIIVALMFVTIWPAILWVPNPQGNVLVLKRDISQAAITPHHMVEDYTLNGSQYLFTLLTRTTPILLVGVSSALLLGAWHMTTMRQKASRNDRLSRLWRDSAPGAVADHRLLSADFWLLCAYVFFFVIMMTIGAKKGDRYILPVWPALIVVATTGIYRLANVVTTLKPWQLIANSVRQFKKSQSVFITLAAISVLYTAGVVWRYHPYEISYASPLFPDNLSQELGWGEGLEQVAEWLNTNTPHAVVASWYPEELRAYTTAQVAHINAHQQGKVQYVVLYRNMFGRAPDHYANNFIDEYYKKREPIFVATIAGKEFAWVYDKWVFEAIVGELLPGVNVSQKIPTASHALYGIDILPATYSSTINRGDLVVKLVDASGGLIQEWRTPVTQLEDNGWLTLALDIPRRIEDNVTVEISAEGTVPKNAPTIRVSRTFDYRPGDIGGTVKHQGDLAIRVRYIIDGQQVTEEEDRLLRRLENK